MIRAFVLVPAFFILGITANKCNSDLENEKHLSLIFSGTIKNDVSVLDDWILSDLTCTSAINRHINEDISMSLKYLMFANHFIKSEVNRLGFAKFFFNGINEKRQRAKLLIEYALMRGSFDVEETMKKVNGTSILFKANEEHSPKDIFVEALYLEHKNTQSVQHLIYSCKFDNHISYHLHGDLLSKQYQAMKDLAATITTLNKLAAKEGKEIGFFIIDKKLLNSDFDVIKQ